MQVNTDLQFTASQLIDALYWANRYSQYSTNETRRFGVLVPYNCRAVGLTYTN